MLRKFLKYLAGFSPVPLSKNEYYDRQTEQIIRSVCKPDSVCMDVGANEGKILSMFVKHCDKAIHYAFEPVPHLYFSLVRKYGSAANILKVAVSDRKGTSTFSFTKDDPAYSSLKARSDLSLQMEQIQIQIDSLDSIIPENLNIRLIKLDIEGGEYDAMVGAEKLIRRCQPYILFEFGKGGSEAFGVSPQKMFDLLNGLGYVLNTPDGFLNTQPSFSSQQFNNVYRKADEYFFVAHPALAQK